MKSILATNICELRAELGISQRELAERVGVSQKAIDFWEKGVNEPKASYILCLAKVFNVTTDFLLGADQ